MPGVLIGGVTYFAVQLIILGTPRPSGRPIDVTDLGGDPLVVLDPGTGLPFTPITLTGEAAGLSQVFLVPETHPEGLASVDDGPISRWSTSQYAEMLQRAVAAETSAESSAASSALSAATAAEAVRGGTTGGGTTDHGQLTEVSRLRDDAHPQYAPRVPAAGQFPTAYSPAAHSHDGYASNDSLQAARVFATDRENHFGFQPLASVDGLSDALDDRELKAIRATTLAEVNAAPDDRLIVVIGP